VVSIIFNILFITIIDQYTTRNYLTFIIHPNITFDVFLLTEGEDITIQTQVFTNPPTRPTVFGIQGESMVSLSATKIRKGNNHCNPDINPREGTDCLAGLWKEDMKKRKLKWMPFLFNKTFYDFGFQQCEDDAESMDSTLMVIWPTETEISGKLYCIELIGYGHLCRCYIETFCKRLSITALVS
jgi:hypothetical protein